MKPLAGEVVERHVHRRLRGGLPGDGRAPRRHSERARRSEAHGHLVDGAGRRSAVLAIAQDRSRFAHADPPVRLRLHEQVVADVGGAARDAEHVAQVEVERPVAEHGVHGRDYRGAD